MEARTWGSSRRLHNLLNWCLFTILAVTFDSIGLSPKNFLTVFFNESIWKNRSNLQLQPKKKKKTLQIRNYQNRGELLFNQHIVYCYTCLSTACSPLPSCNSLDCHLQCPRVCRSNVFIRLRTSTRWNFRINACHTRNSEELGRESSMAGLFPPSSRVTGVKLFAAADMTMLATLGLPEKYIYQNMMSLFTKFNEMKFANHRK